MKPILHHLEYLPFALKSLNYSPAWRGPRWLAALALAIILAVAPAVRAQPGEPAMPLSTTERLWRDPGPRQSAPGAPRLLIVDPVYTVTTSDAGELRYSGRVEPVTASVNLNGKQLTIYPGGVFTGTRSLGDGDETTWRFEATTGARKTVVERTIRRPEPTPPAPDWPLSFYASPVRPTGDMWLNSDEKLKITLYASPGHRAQLRVGAEGQWTDMTEGSRDSERGGVYTLLLNAPKALDVPKLRTVQFRLSGRADGQTASRELTANLRVATIPEGRSLWGRVNVNLATYLKNSDADDWERWGNWIQGTPFPVQSGRGERLRTAFRRGEAGWVENVSVELDPTFQKRLPPALGRPVLTQQRQALTLAWPAVTHPVACVFYPRSEDGGAVLKVSLPGAASLKRFSTSFKASPFASVECADGRGDNAPTITIRLKQPLWGYAMTCDDAKGLRLIVRTRPRVGASGKPLAGLRVMLDAGHGGPSLGARGPSGLLEKDINLVQAAWLERYLKEMGAEVRQVRRGDTDLDLDGRVDLALAWTPDLFISLHHNSVGATQDPLSDSGPITYYHYAHSEELARATAITLASRLKAERGARARVSVFRVNRNVSLCPSVLTESGFICNPYDEYKLRQTETLKASAQAIADGVRNFFAAEPNS